MSTIIGPPAKRHSNGVSLAGRWCLAIGCLLGHSRMYPDSIQVKYHKVIKLLKLRNLHNIYKKVIRCMYMELGMGGSRKFRQRGRGVYFTEGRTSLFRETTGPKASNGFSRMVCTCISKETYSNVKLHWVWGPDPLSPVRTCMHMYKGQQNVTCH